LADVIPARGAAFGDLFNNGHIDVVINNLDSTPTVLRNVVKNGNHWVTLKVIGGAEKSAGRNRRESLRYHRGSAAARRRIQWRELWV